MRIPCGVFLMAVLPLLVFCGGQVEQVQPETAAYSGPELLQKAISYHDPQGLWPNFQGRVRLFTSYSSGVLEDIEFQNAEDYYRCVRGLGPTGREPLTFGAKGDDCFIAVGDNEDPSEEELAPYPLRCQDAFQFRAHHSSHLGLPMALNASGAVVEERVEMMDFQGAAVYSIKAVGKPGEVEHPYWEGARTLYIDKETFAVRGILVESQENPDQYFVAIGEIDVNGIKMPQVKNYYAEGKHNFTDVFVPIAEGEN